MAIDFHKTFGRLKTASTRLQSEVLVVSRTQMGGGNVCIGGYDTIQSRNVRLLTSNGGNQPGSSLFQIGQLWDISYTPKAYLSDPHSEDVLVHTASQVRALTTSDTERYIRDNCEIETGLLGDLFDGAILSQPRGASYISSDDTPGYSVCFWEASTNLNHAMSFNKSKYRYVDRARDTHLAYVGVAPAIPMIPRGKIVRLSLARWWAPADSDEEKKCYLQLSGWF